MTQSFEIPEQLRELTERNIEQARVAYSQPSTCPPPCRSGNASLADLLSPLAIVAKTALMPSSDMSPFSQHASRTEVDKMSAEIIPACTQRPTRQTRVEGCAVSAGIARHRSEAANSRMRIAST